MPSFRKMTFSSHLEVISFETNEQILESQFLAYWFRLISQSVHNFASIYESWYSIIFKLFYIQKFENFGKKINIYFICWIWVIFLFGRSSEIMIKWKIGPLSWIVTAWKKSTWTNSFYCINITVARLSICYFRITVENFQLSLSPQQCFE